MKLFTGEESLLVRIEPECLLLGLWKAEPIEIDNEPVAMAHKAGTGHSPAAAVKDLMSNLLSNQGQLNFGG